MGVLENVADPATGAHGALIQAATEAQAAAAQYLQMIGANK